MTVCQKLGVILESKVVLIFFSQCSFFPLALVLLLLSSKSHQTINFQDDKVCFVLNPHFEGVIGYIQQLKALLVSSSGIHW